MFIQRRQCSVWTICVYVNHADDFNMVVTRVITQLLIIDRNGGCVNRPGCPNFWALLESTDSCRHGARPHHVFPRLACVAYVTSSQWSRWRRDFTSSFFMKASLFPICVVFQKRVPAARGNRRTEIRVSLFPGQITNRRRDSEDL